MDIAPAPSKGSKYLKMNSAGYGLIVLSAVLVAAGILCWLFFGVCNVTVEGMADVAEGRYGYCFVAAEDIDRVKEGMPVTIGNERGKVVAIDPTYYTCEFLKSGYGPAAEKLGLEENKSYYSVAVDIYAQTAGYKPYIIVVETMTPFAYYFAGGK